MLFQEFIKELSKYELILLGEIHGTKEIPFEIKKILDSLIPYNLKNIFFEIPIDEQKYLNKFVKTGKIKDLENIPFFKKTKNSDGRNSKEYLGLIKHLRKKVNIFFIDPISDLKNRDFNMYKNIKKIISKNKGLSVFITGNVHASTDILNFNNIQIKPVGYYLKDYLKNKLTNINFIAMSGSFYNLVLKKIGEKPNISKIIIKKTKDKKYNFNYFIPKVSPCSFMC